MLSHRPMSRLLALLLLFSLAVTNSAAIASVVCSHADAQAHAAARGSEDVAIAQAALSEETSAKSISKKGSLADAAAVSLAAYALPPETFQLSAHRPQMLRGVPAESAILHGRTLAPLAEPPLG